MAARRLSLKSIGLITSALLALYLLAGYVTARLDWVRAPALESASSRLPLPNTRVAGVVHVHTARSHDALGQEREVVSAARAAGIDFVLLSDHRAGDASDSLWATMARISDGVLVIRGQEISLGRDVGRVLTFGFDTVVTGWVGGLDAFGRRLTESGATAIVAHSRSPRVRDSWRPQGAPGIVGWEVFDLADIGRARLGDAWVVYHIFALLVSAPLGRAHHSLLRLHRGGFDQPAVAAFDSLFARQRVTAVGSLDAHPKRRIVGRLVPGYEPFFKSLVNHIDLSEPLPSEPSEAMDALAKGLRSGRVFVSFGDADAAAGFVAAVTSENGPPALIGAGAEWQSEMELRAGFPGRSRGRLFYRVVKDGQPLAWLRGQELAWPVTSPGVFRVEVYRYTLRLGPVVWGLRPWIFANPIRVRRVSGAQEQTQELPVQ